MRYLVDCGGRLVMVHRVLPGVDDAAACEFTVLEADIVSSRWVDVARVGSDTALFVSRWGPVSRRVSRHGLPGNMIHFFDDDLFWINKGERRRGLCGSYNMVDAKTTRLLPLPLLSRELCNGSDTTPMTWLFRM
ncbi:hypothetical protein PR202_ga31406 [Eleusine coracana subsp. coracana]|uniref:KIB1-4 beta-propeller domain-containing protein n=1 Tax=Eleusine coracana subsp. coracana TaxID=191504 RepID=A0AAV5DRU4_ELECO|nr:hypothetical protein PR202_ga31406 [Eleusine coracana subsp. coracana]